MKICPKCEQGPLPGNWDCPQCGFTPKHQDGVLQFSPLLDGVHEDFPPDSYPLLADVEANHFWFGSRNKLIFWALQHHFKNVSKFLEIGCGTGFVISGLAASFPAMELWASEIDPAGLPFVKERIPSANLFQMDAREIPFKDEFNVISAFDVIEHIEDDATELSRKLQASGFLEIRNYSFVSLLIPLMILSRKKKMDTQKFDPMKELRLSPVVNLLLDKVMDFERMMIRMGMSFPFGGSLLCVAQKGGNP